MRTVIAYILVLILGEVCYPIGRYIFESYFFGLTLWMPERSVRPLFHGCLKGGSSSFLAIASALGVFLLLLGPGSFGPIPFAVALLRPAKAIFRSARAAMYVWGPGKDRVAADRVWRASNINYVFKGDETYDNWKWLWSWGEVVGNVIGIAAGAYWLVSW